MLKIFRISSLCEGLSFLLILSVTFGIIPRDFVYFLGMGHGVLFVIYLVLSSIVSHKQSWSIIVWLLVFLASIIPFAFIAVEIFIKKEIQKNELNNSK